MKSQKMLGARIDIETLERIKRRARQEGKTSAAVTREIIDSFFSGRKYDLADYIKEYGERQNLASERLAILDQTVADLRGEIKEMRAINSDLLSRIDNMSAKMGEAFSKIFEVLQAMRRPRI